MNRIKNVVTSLVVCLSLLTIAAIPVMAATSSWSMIMGTNGRIIDGSKNSVYHELDAGTAKITGTIKTISNTGLSGETNTLYISLYNKSSGSCYGTVSVKPSAVVNGTVSVSGTFSENVVAGKKYYLKIYRANSDGTYLNGSGTLKNK